MNETQKKTENNMSNAAIFSQKKKTVEGNYQNNGICHSQSHQVEVVINQHWWRANTPNWKKKTKQQNTNFSVFGFKFPSDRSEMRTTRNTRTTQKLKIRKEKNKMSKGKHFRSIQTKYHSKERERERKIETKIDSGKGKTWRTNCKQKWEILTRRW